MYFGLAISAVLHAALLAWALFTLQSTKELRLPEPEPIAVALITPSELLRMKQGSETAKELESKAKEDPKPDTSKVEAPKPNPILAPTPPAEPPPPAEPVKPKEAAPAEPPKPDPIAEKITEPPPPEPAPGPTPEELKIQHVTLCFADQRDRPTCVQISRFAQFVKRAMDRCGTGHASALVIALSTRRCAYLASQRVAGAVPDANGTARAAGASAE